MSVSEAHPKSGPCYRSLGNPGREPSSASSPSPIHRESRDMSYSSTSVRDISTLSDYDEGIYLIEPSAERSWLPQSLVDRVLVASTDGLERHPNLRAGDSCSASSVDRDNPADTSMRDSPEFQQRDEDDTAIIAQPWMNAGSISNDWKEEDIWSSWKYITNRRGEHSNSARLENRCWRTWTKYKNNLKTVSPETLNWLKDGDVSGLYGPVQPGASKIHSTQTGPSGASLFQTNSIVNINKEPILKKRSISDIMPQKPPSILSLPQQVIPVAQARQKDSRRLKGLSLDRGAATDHTMPPFPSTTMSRGTSSMLPSSASTGIPSLGVERKHIHFNYQVEQCIAVDVKGDDDDDDSDSSTDTNSDDGIMIKLDRPRELAKEGNSLLSDRKMIAMLPSTTLKDREHILEVPETATHYTSGILHSHSVSPFSSQDTARPSEASGRSSKDIIDTDTHSAWYSSGSFEEHDPHRIASTDSLTAELANMRLTPSGMLMPYKEAVTSSNKEVFGRIIDMVNAARDMAYVIWNSSWR